METHSTQHAINQVARQEPIATASLVLGILGVLGLGPLTGVPAIICAHVAGSRARKAAGLGALGGRALAGTIMGYLSLIWLVLLYGLFFPDLSGGAQRNYALRVGANGIGIVKGIMAANTDREARHMTSVWPNKDADFAGRQDYTQASDSETYFADLVRSGVIEHLDYSRFSGAGIAPASNEDAFRQGGHNAWNVIAGLDEKTSDDTPFLFSRNLNISREDLRDTSVNLEERLDTDIKPLGKSRVVVVTKGGAMNLIRPGLLRYRNVFVGSTGFEGGNNPEAIILKAKGVPGTTRLDLGRIDLIE